MIIESSFKTVLLIVIGNLELEYDTVTNTW